MFIVKYDQTVHKSQLIKQESQLCLFETNVIYNMNIDPDEGTFRLVEHQLESTLSKVFPLEFDEEEQWNYTYVALDADGSGGGSNTDHHLVPILGFIAASFQKWNSRIVIHHLYVASTHRRQGIGRQLIQKLEQEQANIWIETSNLNHPGIAAYKRLGFQLCGFDTSLYKGTDCEDEFAIFMIKIINN